ncbi:helix-turn-helix transcriptional regulator [Mucilaginibacter panaciglaebae]|uniref:HTH cro/C1-type domain-containing protein n=1 Tax=Mucilaginibacter panaciglaebae TaxID=502331 RepID=A0ABP7WP68_9SPHI
MISVRHEELIKAFGNQVRQLRKQKGYTMQKLAEEAGIDTRQLSYIELGKVNTTISSIYVIAKALNISISELLKLENY